MRFLLCGINAKYIHSNLAIFSLKAYADRKKIPGAEIILKEYTINNYVEDILQDLYETKADVVIFSCYIWNIAFVEELAEEFHKLRPEVPVWVGGPEVSYETESFLREHPQITGVMIGEGEKTFCELAEYYAGKSRRDKEKQKIQETQRTGEGKSTEERSKPGEIPGIAYRNGDEIIFTAPREMLDLSDIPFCYDKAGDFKNRIIYYESSRGCPFSCSYCLSSVEKQLRFRDAELVKKELQFFIDREVPQVKFVDRTFNCNHAHAMEIWSYIKEHDNGITNFHFEISADLLREEELALIGTMRPGLIQLEIGVQSTNGATIKEIHRTMQLERLKEVVKEVQKHENIHEHLDLIAGLPFEDYDTFAKSFDEIYELRPNQLQLGFLKVLKGSYMFEHATEYGIVYHDKPPYEVMSTKWLSFDDVIKIKRVEDMLEVYYNSGQFEITMKLMECIFDSAFEFFQELGDFYEANGYFGMSHSRIRRCEILLEFLALYLHGCDGDAMTSVGLSENAGDRDNTDFDENAIDRDNTDFDENAQIYSMIQESLVFDLYYRENCKSRPRWATDIGSFKHMTHAYCKNGKLSHVEPFHYIFPDKHTRKMDELPKYHKEPVWALFHYDMREPLDHQALVEYVDNSKKPGRFTD